jgi:hypothetical protein
MTLLLIYAIYNHSTLIFSVYLHLSSLSACWQRIYNTRTVKFSLNYTFPISMHYSTSNVTLSLLIFLLATLMFPWNLGIQVKSIPKLRSKLYYDWRSVSQPVLVSSPIWGSWPDIYYCLTVTVLFLWGALSDGRTGLSFVRVIVCSSKSFVIM